MTEFLQPEMVTVLPHSPYSADLVSCDYFMFPRLKKLLSGRKFSCRCFVETAVFQCLKGMSKTGYENAIRMLVKRLKLCIKSQREYVEQII